MTGLTVEVLRKVPSPSGDGHSPPFWAISLPPVILENRLFPARFPPHPTPGEGGFRQGLPPPSGGARAMKGVAPAREAWVAEPPLPPGAPRLGGDEGGAAPILAPPPPEPPSPEEGDDPEMGRGREVASAETSGFLSASASAAFHGTARVHRRPARPPHELVRFPPKIHTSSGKHRDAHPMSWRHRTVRASFFCSLNRRTGGLLGRPTSWPPSLACFPPKYNIL